MSVPELAPLQHRINEPARRAGMRAHPEFGHRFAIGIGYSGKCGNSVFRAPRVGLNRVFERIKCFHGDYLYDLIYAGNHSECEFFSLCKVKRGIWSERFHFFFIEFVGKKNAGNDRHFQRVRSIPRYFQSVKWFFFIVGIERVEIFGLFVRLNGKGCSKQIDLQITFCHRCSLSENIHLSVGR